MGIWTYEDEVEILRIPKKCDLQCCNLWMLHCSAVEHSLHLCLIWPGSCWWHDAGWVIGARGIISLSLPQHTNSHPAHTWTAWRLKPRAPWALSAFAGDENARLFSSRGDCWPSWKMGRHPKVTRLHIWKVLFVLKLPQAIFFLSPSARCRLETDFYVWELRKLLPVYKLYNKPFWSMVAMWTLSALTPKSGSNMSHKLIISIQSPWCLSGQYTWPDASHSCFNQRCFNTSWRLLRWTEIHLNLHLLFLFLIVVCIL